MYEEEEETIESPLREDAAKRQKQPDGGFIERKSEPKLAWEEEEEGEEDELEMRQVELSKEETQAVERWKSLVMPESQRTYVLLKDVVIVDANQHRFRSDFDQGSGNASDSLLKQTEKFLLKARNYPDRVFVAQGVIPFYMQHLLTMNVELSCSHSVSFASQETVFRIESLDWEVVPITEANVDLALSTLLTKLDRKSFFNRGNMSYSVYLFDAQWAKDRHTIADWSTFSWSAWLEQYRADESPWAEQALNSLELLPYWILCSAPPVLLFHYFPLSSLNDLRAGFRSAMATRLQKPAALRQAFTRPVEACPNGPTIAPAALTYVCSTWGPAQVRRLLEPLVCRQFQWASEAYLYDMMVVDLQLSRGHTLHLWDRRSGCVDWYFSSAWTKQKQVFFDLQWLCRTYLDALMEEEFPAEHTTSPHRQSLQVGQWTGLIDRLLKEKSLYDVTTKADRREADRLEQEAKSQPPPSEEDLLFGEDNVHAAGYRRMEKLALAHRYEPLHRVNERFNLYLQQPRYNWRADEVEVERRKKHKLEQEVDVSECPIYTDEEMSRETLYPAQRRFLLKCEQPSTKALLLCGNGGVGKTKIQDHYRGYNATLQTTTDEKGQVHSTVHPPTIGRTVPYHRQKNNLIKRFGAALTNAKFIKLAQASNQFMAAFGNVRTMVVDEAVSLSEEQFCRMMEAVLKLKRLSLLIFSGDVHQIKSIDGGSPYCDLFSKLGLDSELFDQVMRVDPNCRYLVDVIERIKRGDVGWIDEINECVSIRPSTVDRSKPNHPYFSEITQRFIDNPYGVRGTAFTNEWCTFLNDQVVQRLRTKAYADAEQKRQLIPRRALAEGLFKGYQIAWKTQFDFKTPMALTQSNPHLEAAYVMENNDLFEIMEMDERTETLWMARLDTERTAKEMSAMVYCRDNWIPVPWNKFTTSLLKPGYYITMHTIQGSGFDWIYIFLEGMMDQTHLITAIGRAKKKAVLINTSPYMPVKQMLRKIATNPGEKRQTILKAIVDLEREEQQGAVLPALERV